MHKAGYQQHGFTIVELLVVIVVIGILAAITVVSYTGISQKAIVAMLQSDLTNSVPRLKMYQVEHGAFPATLDTASNCPTGPADTNYCLKPSSGNTFVYSSSSPYSSFSLVATNTNGTSYRITDNAGPVLVTATPITAIAAITGTPQVGQVLTAGALTPSGATASYQWQSSSTSGGTYTNISGATSNTYTLVSGDLDQYIKVIATGTGSYTDSATSAATTAVFSIWIPGQAETGYPTALVGKYIYYMDAAGTPAWRNSAVYCSAPQCSTTVAPAPDVSYPSNKVLVDPIANSGVTFGATYPAQEACKTLGGRLPTMNELSAIYAGKVAGRYGTFPGDLYWSATETNSAYAYVVLFGSNPVTSDKAYTGNYTRCVR